MDLFVSSFVNKIDKKGRISFPSLFRNALPKTNKNEIILYKSLKHKSIEGCSAKRIYEIANRINKLDFFSEDQDDFSTSIFSEIVPTNLDSEGRFQIPEILKKYAGINLEATFIGQGFYFQLCEPKKAVSIQNKSRERLIKKKKSLTSILTLNNKND
tara:strand:+ start:176 stop:646 length:471 start_codon:yes stop_codon:yes gene_type:complete